jgi:hypothetical protein
METTFTIAPRGRMYWIEAVSTGGVRKVLEGFPTEDAALQRLKTLRGPT